MTAVRIGTRRSPLALAQARSVASALEQGGVATTLVEVTTHGDVTSAPLAQLGGTGVFVSALRDALVAGEVDVAVHSLKDLPVGAHDEVVIAAVPVREDPRDVLVSAGSRRLAELAVGARIGTGSPRRAAQLLAARPDVAVVDVRGNVGTRLGLVERGEVDAVVLALAGLRRLGLAEVATEVLDPAVVLPAPGQGALAVECRTGDAEVVALLAALDDEAARAATTAERALLAALEAGCSAPVGALATLGGGPDGAPRLMLEAAVGTVRPGLLRRMLAEPPDDPAGTGRRLAERLLAEGAETLLGARVP